MDVPPSLEASASARGQSTPSRCTATAISSIRSSHEYVTPPTGLVVEQAHPEEANVVQPTTKEADPEKDATQEGAAAAAAAATLGDDDDQTQYPSAPVLALIMLSIYLASLLVALVCFIDLYQLLPPL